MNTFKEFASGVVVFSAVFTILITTYATAAGW